MDTLQDGARLVILKPDESVINNDHTRNVIAEHLFKMAVRGTILGIAIGFGLGWVARR